MGSARLSSVSSFGGLEDRRSGVRDSFEFPVFGRVIGVGATESEVFLRLRGRRNRGGPPSPTCWRLGKRWSLGLSRRGKWWRRQMSEAFQCRERIGERTEVGELSRRAF